MSTLPRGAREVRLTVNPKGLPRPEHFEVVEVPLAVPKEDQVLVRNRYFRVSASLRMMISEGAADIEGVPFAALRPGDTWRRRHSGKSSRRRKGAAWRPAIWSCISSDGANTRSYPPENAGAWTTFCPTPWRILPMALRPMRRSRAVCVYAGATACSSPALPVPSARWRDRSPGCWARPRSSAARVRRIRRTGWYRSSVTMPR
jgi:hypothetical protein